jgi:hypothetical protein
MPTVTQAPQSSPALRRLPACAVALSLLLTGLVSAQERAQVARETLLRRGVGGVVLASLPAGSSVAAGKNSGPWIELTIDGWIATSSVRATHREGFDLIVVPAGGENLRDEPSGKILARLRTGVLLTKRGSRDGWVHVRRTGWAARKDVAGPIETAALAPRQGPATTKKKGPPTQGQKPMPPKAAAAIAATPPESGDAQVEVTHAAPIYLMPDGSQSGTLQPGITGRIVSRTGDWVRVQLEGWVRENDLKPSTVNAMPGVSAAEVRANPARYIGQNVEWRLQFIAIQTADELRAELPEGQPFILARGPLPEPGFVYVIVSKDQLPQFRQLAALQELVARVTIKAARTKYLSTPVVELVSLVNFSK